MSVGIGLVCGLAVMYAWPTLRYASLQNRCSDIIKRFLIRIALDEKDNALSEVCSRRMLEDIKPISQTIRGLGPLRNISEARLLSMTRVTQSTDRAEMLFEANFQKGKLKAYVMIAANSHLAEIRKFHIL